MKNFLTKWYYKRRDRLVQNYNQFLNKLIVIPPDILDQAPSCQSMLVIAPHSDDEVIGCGGTVRKSIQQGSAVEVLIVTGGEKNSAKNIMETRKKEAWKAVKILGITRLSFLDFNDGNLRPTSWLKEELHAKIEQTRPEIIFAPNIFDNHPDHILIARELVNVARDCSVDFQCYFYEVWTPLIANVIIDITQEIGVKTEAMKAHHSQVENAEFVDMILSINRYRAIAALSGNPAMKYAEAFFRLDKKELIKLNQFP